MRGVRAALFALGLPLLAAIGGASDPAGTAPHEALALGRQVYNTRCYFCHGYSGDAKTLAAGYLQPPPRDLRAAPVLTRDRIVDAVQRGRPGTGMQPFGGLLNEAEIAAVAAFVERSFVRGHDRNTAYHTPENGWPDHARYRDAFAFATGAIALDVPVETLDAPQRAGRALFLGSCVTCHDRGRAVEDGPVWAARPLSYPRLDFAPGDHGKPVVDAVSSASVYGRHDVVPQIAGLTPQQRRGEMLFQANCAFCHGADGTGRNWIGQFMEPHARDLTQYDLATMPNSRLRKTIRAGLAGTSMPAWDSVMPPNDIDAVAAYVERAFFRTVPGMPPASARPTP
jgi:cytochrome c oxidase cbb3-type subunit 3